MSKNIFDGLKWPILLNGGGTCKTIEDVEQLLPFVDAVIVGSITVAPRPGNTGETYWFDQRTGTSYNSFNMPNAGAEAYRKSLLPSMVIAARHARKPLIANVAGFNSSEFEALAVMASEAGVNGIELNFGCPNTGESIFSFDPDALNKTVHVVRKKVSCWLSAKISPISDPSMRHQVVCALSECDAIVGTNTFPNARGFRPDGSSVIQAINSLGDTVSVGGAAGSVLRTASLTTIAEIAEWLTHLPTIRVGGISTGEDVLESERAGATAVEIATALFNEGPSVFTRLREEYSVCRQSDKNIKD